MSRAGAATRRILPLLGAGIALLAGEPARGDPVRGYGDPLPPTGETRLATGGTRVTLRVERLTMQARSDDDPDFVERLVQTTARAAMAFNPWEVATLVVEVPVTRKVFSQQTEGYPPVTTAPAGLGDMDLGARLFLLDRAAHGGRHGLALTLGSTLPTGASSAQEEGYRLAEHAQLGTGAPGPYLGARYTFGQEPWRAHASLAGRLWLANEYGYRYGPALLWSLGGGYRPVDGIELGLDLDGRYAGRDLHERRFQANTGGFVLAVTPAVRLGLPGGLWLEAGAQLPVLTYLFGELRAGVTLTAGLQYTFE